MTFECEFCKKEFSNKYILKNHQKTAAYCLKLQDIQVETIYSCENCSKKFNTKSVLKTHLKSCTVTLSILKENHKKEMRRLEKKYENQLQRQEDKYEKRIKELQKQMQELAKIAIEKPTKVVKTTTNNTTTTNNVLNLKPLDLDNEDFKSIIYEGYDMKYILQGIRGVAEFAKDKLLVDEDGKSRYICVDPSRQIFKYVDANGETRRDVKARKLTNKVTPDIVNKVNEIVGEERKNKENYAETIDELTNIFFDIKDLRRKPDKLSTELSKIICN